MQALILAGGRGIRLNPLTNELPVPLLFLPGGTLLDHLIHHLHTLAIDRIAIVLQYGGDQIARYLDERYPNLFHIIPQYPPFTFGGALASAAPWIEEETVVLHGNSFHSGPLDRLLDAAPASQAAFLLPPSDVASASFCACSAYLLPPEHFYRAAQQVESQSLCTFQDTLRRDGVRTTLVPYDGWSRTVHSADDLLMVNRYLLKHWHEVTHPPEAGSGYDALNFTWIAPNAEIEATVSPLFSTIGPGATVRGGRLYNALLLPGAQLEDSTEKNVVLFSVRDSLHRLYATTTTLDPNPRLPA